MYENKEIGEVTTLVKRGVTPKYVEEDGYTIINQRCIRDNRLTFDDARLTHKEKTSIKPEKNVQKWDVLVNSTGVGTLGRTAQVVDDYENTTVDTHVTIVRPDLEQIYGRYLGYVMAHNERIIENLAKGATGQTELSRHLLSEIEITVPGYEKQKRIASILSAFDDLIENNSRRIEILEEMARRIYREWFVHFRYPGHEDDEVVDSGTGLGEIPEGWEAKSFDEISEVLSGGTPKTKINEYWDGDLPFFSPKDATDNFFVHNTSRTVSQKGVDNCASKLYPPKTIFITARGTVGKLNMPLVPMAMNQSCYALKAKDGLGQYFVFFSIENLVQSLRKKAHGAVFDTIIMDTFKQIYSIVPPLELAKKFEKKVEPILDQIQVLLKKNENLKATRDLLLPKLISGEVEYV